MTTKTKKLPIELFTCPDSSRYCLGAPWTLPDGRLGCTDTRIALVFDATLWDGKRDLEGRRPAVLDVLKPIDSITEWHELPEVDECDDCDGKTLADYECEDCYGDGKRECDMGHDHDCEGCNGEGNLIGVECQTCLGEWFELSNRDVCGLYVRRAKMLPNCQWGVASDKPNEAVFLRFDGGIGVVMPRAKGGAK